MKEVEYNLVYDTSWSQLLPGPLGEYVSDNMKDSRRKYHNMDHVCHLYQRAQEYNVPYSRELDAAILFHDVIYDEYPDREFRSAETVKLAATKYPGMFENIQLSEVNLMIINTIEHGYTPNVNPWMIRLDVIDLSDPDLRYSNFWKLNQEAQMLYGISLEEAASGTVKFMNSFQHVMKENACQDHEFSEKWNQIVDGCMEVTAMSKALVEAESYRV